MRKPLENFAEGGYERPNQPWICGLASDGQACPSGPTTTGRCPALAECLPIRDGDRWACNRSPLRGGPCEDGPLPDGTCACVNRCRPTPSLRRQRGRFVTACTIFSLGVLLMMLSGPQRTDLLVPGPLAHHHAQLLESQPGSAHCAACHTAADAELSDWLLAAVLLPAEQATQSTLCLKCHAETVPSETALAAHSVLPDHLHQITRSRSDRGQSRLSDALSPRFGKRDALACSACHREHHGEDFDLTAISDAACQNCHVEAYHSFATDHPDFGIWPYERRTRIVFDHAAHQAKHFPAKTRSFECALCHLEDGTRSVQLLAGYESSCAACHDAPLADSSREGIALLALPTIDLDALQSAGFHVGEWPEWATGEFDGRLPPAMKLLLAADATYLRALRTLGHDFEWTDVDPGSAAQLRAAADVTWATKRLFADLARDGRRTLQQRLQVVLGRKLSDAHVHALASGLTTDTVRAAQTAWLPQLSAEMESRPMRPADNSSTSSRPPPPSTSSTPQFRSGPAGEWSRDDTTFRLIYQPTGHADPLLSAWLDLAACAAGESAALHTAFRELAKPTAAGQCASCHSIDRSETGPLLVNWQPTDRTNAPRGFTRFSHGPHVIQPELADCTHCHQIDQDSNSGASYANFDAHSFVSDFQTLARAQCVACHVPHAAGDRCTQCHNYHVDLE